MLYKGIYNTERKVKQFYFFRSKVYFAFGYSAVEKDYSNYESQFVDSVNKVKLPDLDKA